MVREEHWHFHLRLIISDERYRYRCSVLLSFSRIAGYTSEPEWNVGDAQCYAVCSKEKSTIPHLIVPEISFLLGIGIGAEYPCGSVSASEQSEQAGINKRAQHRWVALATSEKNPISSPTVTDIFCHPDTMIDSGFVVAAFVPLVLFWMYIETFPKCSCLWTAVANLVL